MSRPEVLDIRGHKYGSFLEEARIAETIVHALETGSKYEHLTPAHRLAVKMVAVKLARIVNGGPIYADNWVDIAGYATLALESNGET